ncbi:dehydrogenase [Candidatus Poribacteria bacterium]|nr:dehydrogenase [Candidatus Poribacteria bacterium]MXV82855.1 dehydrogenase [Candidatus Poribacteria bacterium]MYA56863.1 dehydrogenase [Candidatus Poribacteria bacterium]
MSKSVFRVGVTRDFLGPDGTCDLDDIAGPLFDKAGLHWEYIAENTPALQAEQVQDYDALLVLGAGITAETFTDADKLAVIARFGVGYDKVDVEACTENGVLLTIAPDGVRRPVATSIMTFVLSLGHQLLIKDRLIRAGGWRNTQNYRGMGLVGRTLGLVGMGNIGKEAFKLAKPFGMRHITYDPYITPADAAEVDVEPVDLDALMQTADFVCVCCPLNEETRGLINARRIGLMKPTAYLINTARGPIVDQKALTEALQNRRIQGAGLDVFEQEPIDDDDPLLSLDNVIVTPHSICWTDECFEGNAKSACESIISVASGKMPLYIVNREVTDNPKLQQKLGR